MDESGMMEGLIRPVELVLQDHGSILVTFPGVPEALTEGETEAEAMEHPQDCLVAALGGCISVRRAIPRPSPARGRTTVPPPALTIAKIALYDAMRSQGVGNTPRAVRLGLSEGAARRLVDLDHRSQIGGVETALHALGLQLAVSTQADNGLALGVHNA